MLPSPSEIILPVSLSSCLPINLFNAITIAIANGSKTNTINKVNQFTITFIGFSVNSAIYLSGPISAATSLFDSISNTCNSSFVIESVNCSSLTFIFALVFTAVSNSFVNNFLVEDDWVVIILPKVSVYCILLLEIPFLKSRIDFVKLLFSIL